MNLQNGLNSGTFDNVGFALVNRAASERPNQNSDSAARCIDARSLADVTVDIAVFLMPHAERTYNPGADGHCHETRNTQGVCESALIVLHAM